MAIVLKKLICLNIGIDKNEMSCVFSFKTIFQSKNLKLFKAKILSCLGTSKNLPITRRSIVIPLEITLELRLLLSDKKIFPDHPK